MEKINFSVKHTGKLSLEDFITFRNQILEKHKGEAKYAIFIFDDDNLSIRYGFTNNNKMANDMYTREANTIIATKLGKVQLVEYFGGEGYWFDSCGNW